jgi:integrase
VRSGILSTAEDGAADWQGAKLADLLDDFLLYLEGKGTTPEHRKERARCLNRVFSDCGFVTLRDAKRHGVETWLLARQRENMGARCRNAYRAAVVSFGAWLAREGRLLVNPFEAIPAANERADRRHSRRAFLPEELARLLEAARTRPLHDALHKNRGDNPADLKPATRLRLERLGHERMLIYKTLAMTGLRRGELERLTVGDLHLEENPRVALPAAKEKNRKGAVLPLRADLAADLSEWLDTRLNALRVEARRRNAPIPAMLSADTPVFNVPGNLIKILNRDLVFAGLADVDAAGKIQKADSRGRVLDVHSFRLTFGSYLQAAGVPLRTAQALMRHSTPELTANVYQDTSLLDMRGAVAALPDMQPDNGDTRRDDREAAAQGDPTVALSVALNRGNGGVFPALRDNKVDMHRPDTERQGQKITGNNDGALQGVSYSGRKNKDGRGGQIRTADFLLPKQAR